MKTNLILLVSVLCIVINCNALAQFGADVDGKLDVAPVNGNMTYTYPISNNTIDGFNLKVDLVYSNNVSFANLAGYQITDTTEGWLKLNFTHPAWMIGVNGFAVNVLTYKANFMRQHIPATYNLENQSDVENVDSLEAPFDVYNSLFGGSEEYGDRVLPLVEGYDFCNRMYRINKPDDQDVIRILRSDGGLLELRNPKQRKNVPNENSDSLYIGYYYENSVNPEGYAIVEYDTVTNWPDYVKEQFDGVQNRNSYKPRKIKYYRGDGLEYVFGEVTVPYGLRATKMLLSRIMGRGEEITFLPPFRELVPGNVTPTVFYLEQINSDIRNIATFKREWHNFRNDSVTLTRGRAFITEFANHKICIGNQDMKIEALDRTISCKLFNPIAMIHNPKREDYTFNNVEAEIYTPYKYYYDTAWVNYQVAEIADPVYRKTKFRYLDLENDTEFDEALYFYSGFSLPFANNFGITKCLMKEITEPTKAYDVSYRKGPYGNTINKSDLSNNSTEGNVHYALTNSVDTIMKYEYRNNAKGTLLQTMSYFIDEPEWSWNRNTKVTLTDEILNESDSMKYFFSRYSVAQFRTNEDEDYLAPEHEILLPLVINTYFPDRIVIQETEYAAQSSIGGSSPYNLLPVKNTTKIQTAEYGTFVKSLSASEYNFTTINTFGGNTEMANAFGKGISKAIQKLYHPVTKRLLLHSETDFIHFPLEAIQYPRVDTIFNKISSMTETEKARNLDGLLTTVKNFDYVEFGDWKLLPLYYLPAREIVRDSNNTILSGKSYCYNTQFNPNDVTNRRGALLADSIISRNGTETLLNSKYQYSGGRKQNLLAAAENIYGAKKRMYFSYGDVAALDGEYPKGKKLYDNDNIDDTTLFNEMYEFETPVAVEEYIRKVKPYGTGTMTYTDTLRTFTEKTYYGQTGAAVDANGWYAANRYDLNGRLLTSWLPFDFPQCSTGINTTSRAVPLFAGSQRIKTQKEEMDSSSIGEGKWKNYTETIEEYELDGGSATHAPARVGVMTVNDLPTIAITPFGDVILATDGSVNHLTHSYEAELNYIASEHDAFHSCGEMTSAKLRVAYWGNYVNTCMTIKIKTNMFGFEENYVIGCPALEMLEGAETPQSPTSTPTLDVDISSLLSDIRNMGAGDTLKFSISSISMDGDIGFVNVSEDQKPQIIFDNNCCKADNDYTVAYEYDDYARIVTAKSKIDDGLHTSNPNWQPTYTGNVGRYSSGASFYGAENRLLSSQMYIGSPLSPIRTDSVVYGLSGSGLVLTAKDQLGNIVETEYDHGRVTKAINADNTYKEFANAIINTKSPGFPLFCFLLGIDSTRFYGSMEYYLSIDENSKRNFELYDVNGKLVQKIVGYLDSTNTKTNYFYDIAGNLTQTIHDNDDISYYIYDDYNRLKFKVDKNIDTVAYAYNKLGQVRFSQNKEQKLKNAVSFVQYDDLGRTTVSGEALIDTVAMDLRQSPEWLTDVLETDIIHYNGFNPQTDIPTLNPTIWETTVYTQQPRFWDFNLLDTAHRMPRLTERPEITDPGPYLMLPASYYSYNTGAEAPPANFENVASYGNFIKSASHYDEMPPNAGAIWDRFPERTKWDSLVPYRPWDRGERQPRNLRGRKAAAAYRDDGTEPFHYIVMSYDPRGRVEALLRFTENLGFDAVYYTYNSANSVISSRVVDAQRQYVTWYGYDDNGRVDSVWTKMTEPGTGFGLDNLKIPDSPARSETPDIVYSYDKRGNIDTVKFVPAFVTQSFAYNPRGWVDSMTAKGQYDDILFRQKFERDPGGNILKQVSKHAGRDELTQTYRYDRLYRLAEWSDGRDSVEYEYDRMGNRLAETKNLTDETNYAFGFTNNTNRLSAITHGSETKHYTYNNLGAVTSIASMSGNDTITAERFGYGGGGRIKRYTKKLFSATPETYDWRYRYSALGGREQKRLYYNTKGDSINGDSYNYYGWTYYLLGAGGEQLAVYKGVQAAHEDSSGHAGRRVYMYNESYISLGGTLVTLPDNTKQFNAMDNIGSVRLTVSVKGQDIAGEHFDYKPFGDTLNAEGESRIGYAAQERDEESRYFAMGARQYDPLSGRFLSVDPLYESFPDKTPYHYCNNNPISFKDPSGLSPEGEKGKEDEVQVVYTIDLSQSYELLLATQESMEEARNTQKMYNLRFISAFNFLTNTELNWMDNFWADGGGGAGSGGSMANYWAIRDANNSRLGNNTPEMTYELTNSGLNVYTNINGIQLTFKFNEETISKYFDVEGNEGLADAMESISNILYSVIEKVYSTPLGNLFLEGFRSSGLIIDMSYDSGELTKMWKDAHGETDGDIGGNSSDKWAYKTWNIEEASRPAGEKLYKKGEGSNRFIKGRIYLAFDAVMNNGMNGRSLSYIFSHELTHHWDKRYWSGFMGFPIKFPETRADWSATQITFGIFSNECKYLNRKK